MAANPHMPPTTDNIIEADPGVSIVFGSGRMQHTTDEFSSSTMPLIPAWEMKCTLLAIH